MPNWVMNELTCIFQTKEELDAFKNKANTEGLYNSFIPMPSILDGTRSPHLDPDAFIAGVNKSKGTKFQLAISKKLSRVSRSDTKSVLSIPSSPSFIFDFERLVIFVEIIPVSINRKN